MALEKNLDESKNLEKMDGQNKIQKICDEFRRIAVSTLSFS